MLPKGFFEVLKRTLSNAIYIYPKFNKDRLKGLFYFVNKNIMLGVHFPEILWKLIYLQ